jgi:hypothetical protein
MSTWKDIFSLFKTKEKTLEIEPKPVKYGCVTETILKDLKRKDIEWTFDNNNRFSIASIYTVKSNDKSYELYFHRGSYLTISTGYIKDCQDMFKVDEKIAIGEALLQIISKQEQKQLEESNKNQFNTLKTLFPECYKSESPSIYK